jgi:HNH endonuclease
MNTNQIRALSDSELLMGLKNSVLEERRHTTQVLEYLREVDRRRLFADSGYPSLWEFCVKELGYSEGSASRRISSMRLLRDLPELKADLLSGKQNLSSLSQAQKFFRSEEKHHDVKLTDEQKQGVLKKLEGKSTRECEKELLKMSSVPIEISKPEKQRVLDEAHTELRLVLDSELLEKLNRIQALRSHANPSMSYTELLKFMAEDILKRIDPLKKAKKEKKEKRSLLLPPAPAVKHEIKPEVKMDAKASRSGKRVPIPVATKRQVWLRDGGKCGFVDAKTGNRCDSWYFLELDHIVAVALGGSNDPSNLRLRCRGHNQRTAFQTFGQILDFGVTSIG